MERFWTNFHSLVGGGFSPNSSPSSSPSHSASTLTLTSTSTLTTETSAHSEETKLSRNNNDCLGLAVTGGSVTSFMTSSLDAQNQNEPSIVETEGNQSTILGQACENSAEELPMTATASGHLSENSSNPEFSVISSTVSVENDSLSGAGDVEFMNEQNLARSRSPKPNQAESNGWDLRGQLLGAGSKVLSPISSSSKFVKSLFWSANSNANDNENSNSSEAANPTPNSSSSSTAVVDSSTSSSTGPYFGVNIPPESRTTEAQPGVFQSKDEILKMIKKCQGARFKSFSTLPEAESFAHMTEDDLLNSSLLIKTPSKPRNPVFINSPPPPPKLQQQHQSPLQLQHQQQHQQQLLEQQLNTLASQGERLAFKAPKTQDLMTMRRYITAGNKEAIENLVWSNPRYLISSGDTPTIVQEGFHYTAMHVAARHGKHEIVEMLIDTLSEIRLMKILYGEESDEVVKSRQTFLLDLYLNLPDKGANDTPLHLACKFGHIEVIRILLKHPFTSRNEINKFKETPAEVVCSRCPRGEDEADIYRLEILKMFEKVFVVPILRPGNGLGPPKVGAPVHFTSVYPSVKSSINSTSSSPLPFTHSSDTLNGLNYCNSESKNNGNFVISAYAGPMMEKEAMTYRMRLCRPFRNSVRQLIISRNSPIKTTKKRNESDVSASSSADATTSKITTTRDDAEPVTNDGSSGDDLRPTTRAPLSSLQNNDAAPLKECTVTTTTTLIGDGSGEMLPSTVVSEKPSPPTTSSSITQGSGETPPLPSTSETKLSGFATPVKVTPPWSLGSAARSLGSGDPFQSTPVSSAPRLIDSEKGLEHEGRHLAGDMNVEWKERWEILGCNDLLDFGAASGLKKLEEYFQSKYEEVEERESNIQELALEDSFIDEDADDSLGDLVRTFKTKLVIMSPTREDFSFDNVVDTESNDNERTSSAGGKRSVTDNEDVVTDLSLKFDECSVESATTAVKARSPSSLKELCRLANPFDTVGVTRTANEGDAGVSTSGVLRDPGLEAKQRLFASAKSTSTIPFEAQVFVKGSLPSHMDVELLHALRNSPIDPALYPYLFKWLHLVKSNREEERVRWPTTPGAPASGRGLPSYQTTPRGVVASEGTRKIPGATGDAELSPRSAGLRPTTLSFDFSPAEVKRKSRIDKVDIRNSPNRCFDVNGDVGT